MSSDDWDAQMLFFMGQGFRVIAHDRRGHGRSAQVWDGHDIDHYADDVAAVVNELGVQGAIHVGHSTGEARSFATLRDMEKTGFPRPRLSVPFRL
ncbi:alpha/beta fold hydrolase [Granulicella cerasi]|uniref:Alpha/beta fold hydrolase n=1 Tax=Granulicella cerasi TaxID=741063 RepID=A0ABW1ZDJ7_9BACT|nr:alpha/beta hydrolase [Granulicella cerasi]